ncbi:MAG: hypothetical protein ACOZB0_06395 [Pseudomonadota bacterium]
MTNQLIYDESTKTLHAPDGSTLKQPFCPKGMRWEQLEKTNLEDAHRTCNSCGDEVFNLDALGVTKSLELLRNTPNACVYFTNRGGKVTFVPRLANVSSQNVESDTNPPADGKHGHLKILVLGVGGCGLSAVSYMMKKGIHGVEYAFIDTDQNALKRIEGAVMLGIGEERQGLG